MSTILFYDGDCGFCNKTVQFIIKNEKDKSILFSPFQSEFAKELFVKQEIKQDYSSVLILYKGDFYTKSEAFVIILSLLKQFYPVMGKLLGNIPLSISNFFYDILAKRRKSILRTTSCSLKSPDDKERFFL